jgi:hypothetical protein
MRRRGRSAIVSGGDTKEDTMRTDLKARPGDRLVIHAHHVGEHVRDAEILEATGPDGGPPVRVRWSDTGEETLHFPGNDATVEHLTATARAKR